MSSTNIENAASPLKILPAVVPPVVKDVLQKTGFKPAQSYKHAILRIVLLLAVIGVVVYSIYDNKEEIVTLEEVSHLIKPNTILYKSILEMDEKCQNEYLKSMKKTLSPDPTKFKKYLDNIKVALIAGIATEYIMNGNTSKPIGAVAKTIVFNMIFICIS